jgi:phage-related protein
MTFKYRFAYYLLGFIIGCFFVAAVLSGKDTRCNYFPNARVLNDLRNKPFEYSEQASKILAETWIDTVDIKNCLTYGDVDFDMSNVKYENGKIYFIEGKTIKNQEILLEVINYSGKAVLKDILKK